MRAIGAKMDKMALEKLLGYNEHREKPIVGKVTTDSWGRPMH